MHAPHPSPPQSSPARPERRPWTALVLLALAQFMVILDITVVNVALPTIGGALGFDAADLPWVVTAYVLCTGGLMLLGGRLGDALGARRVFTAGLLLFTAASLASGVAGSPGMLVAARAAQGVGAAMLVPCALALITATYQGPQRATALAVWGALGSAGAAAGVLLGGIITTLLTWRWIFFINLPVGVLVALATPHVVAGGRLAARERVDVPGAITLMTGLIALVYGIQGAATDGWGSSRTLVPMLAGAALLAVFAAVERRVARPLVAPAVWRGRPLTAGAVVMLGATGLLVGAFFLNTMLLQETLGATALETGLAFLPMTVAILAGAHAASHVVRHAGSRGAMVAGLLVVAGGALLLTGLPADPGYAANVLPGLLAIGLGVGMTFVSVSITAMHDVDHAVAGVASGVMSTAHELGAALGVAVLASVATAGASSAGFAAGYVDGFRVATIAAVGLALLAAVAAPSVRPAPGAAMPIH